MNNTLSPAGAARLVADYKSGMTIDQLKQFYHVSSETVYRVLDHYGAIPKRRGAPFIVVDSALIDKVCELAGHHSVYEISRLTSLSTYKVRQILIDNGVDYETRGKKKTNLSEQDELEMCEMYKTTSMVEVARHYHIEIRRCRRILVSHGVVIRNSGARIYVR